MDCELFFMVKHSVQTVKIKYALGKYVSYNKWNFTYTHINSLLQAQKFNVFFFSLSEHVLLLGYTHTHTHIHTTKRYIHCIYGVYILLLYYKCNFLNFFLCSYSILTYIRPSSFYIYVYILKFWYITFIFPRIFFRSTCFCHMYKCSKVEFVISWGVSVLYWMTWGNFWKICNLIKL